MTTASFLDAFVVDQGGLRSRVGRGENRLSLGSCASLGQRQTGWVAVKGRLAPLGIGSLHSQASICDVAGDTGGGQTSFAGVCAGESAGTCPSHVVCSKQ